MAKIGKYSSGLGKQQPKNAPFVNSNGGYEKRQSAKNLMKKHFDMDLTSGGVTAQGYNKSIKVTKNVKRKM